MSKLVKTPRMLPSMALWLCLLPGPPALAEPVDPHELDAWVPAVSIVTGLGAQRAEGYLGTTDVIGDPVTAPLPPSPAQPIVPGTPTTSRTRMMTPFVGLAVELMTPSWTPLAGHPRLFAHIDVAYAFGPAYNIPNIGDPGIFVKSPRVISIVEGAITGQGGRTSAEVRPLWVMAGAGIAFTFDARGRALRVKPSVEYLREEIDIGGLVRRAVAPEDGNSPNLSDFRAITLTIDKKKVYHGIGPGLELELDTMRTGPFVLALYAAAKAWTFPDNKKHVFTTVNEFGEGAEFHFLKNEWAFAGALGVRFRWVPE